MAKKIKGGLKSKGLRVAGYEKMAKQENESSKHAPSEQMFGGSAKQVSCEHVAMGNKKEPK